MDTFEQKRGAERVVYHSLLQFTVLSAETAEFQRVQANGEIIDASESGVGIITEFPLKPEHVLEWGRQRPERETPYRVSQVVP